MQFRVSRFDLKSLRFCSYLYDGVSVFVTVTFSDTMGGGSKKDLRLGIETLL